MPKRRRVVIRPKQKSETELPGWAGEGALLAQWLEQQGKWAEVAERFQVVRPGPCCYEGIDIFLFFLLFFAGKEGWSIRQFGEEAAGYRHQLAALGHRREFPTPSSVSRFLSVVTPEVTQGLAPWLLLKGCEARAVLRHPAAASYDTQGEAWHLYDWDGTSTVLRHRALPTDPALPPCRRRSAAMARPGYTGRKRGEVKFSRATLQHAGTGLWLDLVTEAGRADIAAKLPSALQAIRATCEYADLPLSKAVLRADGAGGNVPWISACQQASIHYLCRSAHYGFLEDPDLMAALAKASWFQVPSSGSGPARWAAEGGQVVLKPSRSEPGTPGPDLSPVTTRLVVSRFESESKAGAGVVRDGWQYELYVTDLLPEAWPCEEVVASYYGRGGQENRFGQEDRELGLDRIFSYHLPGQELVNLLGLSLWNLRITRGFELQPPAAQRPALVRRSRQGAQGPAVPLPAQAPLDPPSQAASPLPMPGPVNALCIPNPKLSAALAQLDWNALLTSLQNGWQRSADGLALQCPTKTTLPLSLIPAFQGRNPRLRFLAPPSACQACPGRTDCGATDSPSFAKSVTVMLDQQALPDLPALVIEEQHRRRLLRQQRTVAPPAPLPNRAAPTERLRRQPVAWSPPADLAAGPFAASGPLLLVAQLRRGFLRACRDLEVHVERTLPPAPPRPCPLLASSAADRQRRRQTWHHRLRKNQLPPDAEIVLTFSGADPRLLRRLLPPQPLSARSMAA